MAPWSTPSRARVCRASVPGQCVQVVARATRLPPPPTVAHTSPVRALGAPSPIGSAVTPAALSQRPTGFKGEPAGGSSSQSAAGVLAGTQLDVDGEGGCVQGLADVLYRLVLQG